MHWILGIPAIVVTMVFAIMTLFFGHPEPLGKGIWLISAAMLVPWGIWVILANPVARLWVKDNPLAVASGVIAAAGLIFLILGWVKTGFTLLLVAALLFLRHSCRWGNWCQDVRSKWNTTGKAKVVQWWRDGWASVRQTVINVVEFFVDMLRALVGNYPIEVVLALLAAAAWWLYDDGAWDRQSWWFYGVLTAMVLLIVVRYAYVREKLAGGLLWVLGGVYRRYRDHYKSLPGLWKGLYWGSLVGTPIFCWWLWSEDYHKYLWVVAGVGAILFFVSHIGDAVSRLIAAMDPWGTGRPRPATPAPAAAPASPPAAGNATEAALRRRIARLEALNRRLRNP